jgi:hypothetical protein
MRKASVNALMHLFAGALVAFVDRLTLRPQ